MNITIIGKNMDVGDALRSHVETQLEALSSKYFPDPLEGKVVISKDAALFKVDISVHAARGIILQSNGDAHEPYPAFDNAAERIEKRLRRYKRRLRDHHRHESAEAAVTASQYILNSPAEDEPDVPDDGGAIEETHGEPVIVAEMPTVIETLTVSEAVMRLDLGQLPALMFRNKGHGGMNVIYRRPDGNIGWVDPAGSAAVEK